MVARGESRITRSSVAISLSKRKNRRKRHAQRLQLGNTALNFFCMLQKLPLLEDLGKKIEQNRGILKYLTTYRKSLCLSHLSLYQLSNSRPGFQEGALAANSAEGKSVTLSASSFNITFFGGGHVHLKSPQLFTQRR